ncbi:uncharacterized protein ARMOST_18472 [Armillaria ostoyae]|uniref:Uncharacterized protein n=1 Tax=Armillaria ostoyae TaxID=47428 RepID=A0A284S1X0_ARMOS|nr:uncharacterized protein ARMOST_18472 [Armillaria ostoyae]
MATAMTADATSTYSLSPFPHQATRNGIQPSPFSANRTHLLPKSCGLPIRDCKVKETLGRLLRFSAQRHCSTNRVLEAILHSTVRHPDYIQISESQEISTSEE